MPVDQDILNRTGAFDDPSSKMATSIHGRENPHVADLEQIFWQLVVRALIVQLFVDIFCFDGRNFANLDISPLHFKRATAFLDAMHL